MGSRRLQVGPELNSRRLELDGERHSAGTCGVAAKFELSAEECGTAPCDLVQSCWSVTSVGITFARLSLTGHRSSMAASIATGRGL